MTEADQLLLQDARQYVSQLFVQKIDPVFRYHNLVHTTEVVKACEILGDFFGISDNERLSLLLAAWFHDTGYSGGMARDHEQLSKKIASDFLLGKGVDQSRIEVVTACIEATKVPQSPNSLIEKIICDADLYHLGSEEFDKKNKLLRQEISELHEKKIEKKDWRKENIRFLQQHHYFTSYGKEKLEPVKQANLKRLLEKELKKDKDTEIVVTLPEPPKKPVMPEKQETDPVPKKAKSRTERSVTTMFRIMSENHVSLSQMADSKANIMISVNTIVMSIMVSVLLGKLQFYPEYIIPTIILLAVCLSAVVYAILATRPNVTRGVFTKEDIENKKVNLLFFGNFYNMSLSEYDWAMKTMMEDNEYLNSSMIKDIYFLGVVLARKYKYLRLSYNIFMFGLIIAIVAFGVAFFVSDQPS
jgi:predicted metal-dependent HD superfamily phosphohydrolase